MIIMPDVANSTSTCDSALQIPSRPLYSMPSITAPSAARMNSASAANRNPSTAISPGPLDSPRAPYQRTTPSVASSTTMLP